MSFEWQTEEEHNWDDQNWPEEVETAAPSKFPWRTLILIVILLSAVGTLVYQQVNRRLDETTAAVEADIFATHNLLSRAAANQDDQLGKAVLSGRDIGWSQVQAELLAAGLFYENPTFGLALANASTAYAPLSRQDDRFMDLQLEPDLNGAELSYAREYVAFTASGLQSVTLKQTAVYRRGESRWLLSPPLEGFWGEWQTKTVDSVTYIFPQRDEEILNQLTDGISELVAAACEDLPELGCTTPVQIRFETNPESLLAAADLSTLYGDNLRLELPAPTLVGLPVNAAGYEALQIAYAAKVVSALVADAASYSCCDHAPLVQALVAYELGRVGLASWPVNREMQQMLADSGVDTELLFPYWSSIDFSLIHNETSWQLFGFVDFLLKQYVPQTSVIDLISDLTASRTYRSWLVGLRDGNEEQSFGEVGQISRDWWFYAITQAETAAVSQQPISLPAQDLQVGCLQTGSSFSNDAQTALYRYSLGSDAWVKEFDYDGLAFFNPLPQDNGVILQLVAFSDERFWQTLLWQEGTSVELMSLNDIYSISLGQVDPNGRFLLSYLGVEEDEALPEPFLIDMESCLTGNCDGTELAQTPHWSPNGQWMLLTDMHLFETTQYTVDGRIITLNPGNLNISSPIWLRAVQSGPATAVSVGEGSSPFWLNNEQFGYIRSVAQTSRPAQQELVIASINHFEPIPILTTEVLSETLPEGITRGPLVLQYAIAHPTEDNQLVVMASNQASDGFLFQVNLQTEDIAYLFSIDYSRGEHSLGFSPDGRFLVATGSLWPDNSPGNQDLPFGALHLYDFSTGEYETILMNTEVFFPAFTFDWSKDSHWLAFTRDRNMIGLIAPAYDYQQMIVNEAGNCISLAWINEQADH